MAAKKNDVEVGTIHKTKSSGDIVVIERNGTYDLKVKFIDTGYVTKCTSSNIRNGNIKDRTRPHVCGVGYMGIGNHSSIINGRQSKIYGIWGKMIARCYQSKEQEAHPTYQGCVVCDEWLNFQIFAEWYKTKNPTMDKSLEIDKDILFYGNKVYSPETCILVPALLNSFTTGAGSIRGDWPIGVTWHKHSKKFAAQCWNPFTKKQERVGLFSCQTQAYEAWKDRKLSHALALKPMMDMIDDRVYHGIVKIINNAR